jgi:hypothetical protein
MARILISQMARHLISFKSTLFDSGMNKTKFGVSPMTGSDLDLS